MEIRKAQENDLIEVLYLIGRSKQDLRDNELYHWNSTYTSRELVREDVFNGNTYILLENKVIVGTVTLYEKNHNDVYANVEFLPEKFMILRRLVVFSTFQQKGYASALLKHATDLASEQKFDSIITEAYYKNERYIEALKKNGFNEAGKISLPPQELVFDCFEKKLN